MWCISTASVAAAAGVDACTGAAEAPAPALAAGWAAGGAAGTAALAPSVGCGGGVSTARCLPRSSLARAACSACAQRCWAASSSRRCRSACSSAASRRQRSACSSPCSPDSRFSRARSAERAARSCSCPSVNRSAHRRCSSCMQQDVAGQAGRLAPSAGWAYVKPRASLSGQGTTTLAAPAAHLHLSRQQRQLLLSSQARVALRRKARLCKRGCLSQLLPLHGRQLALQPVTGG